MISIIKLSELIDQLLLADLLWYMNEGVMGEGGQSLQDCDHKLLAWVTAQQFKAVCSRFIQRLLY